MVIKEKKSEAQQHTPPFLGRSVRVVSTIEPVDAQQTPHEKNKRGELGAPLFNYYNNSTAKDPIGRIGTGNHAADRRNVMQVVVNQAPRGGVSPDKT